MAIIGISTMPPSQFANIFILVLLTFLFSINDALATEQTQNKSSPRRVAAPNTIALTFDDGPHPVFTRQILDILKKYNVKATFFIVGARAKAHPDVIKEIDEQGHVVASHSMTHPNLTKLSPSKLNYEIEEPNNIVMNLIGKQPKCLRYPYGASNAFVREQIRQHHMEPLPMGFNSFDYYRPGTQKIIAWVLKNAYSTQVILLHDGYNHREQTVAALPAIIEGIKKKGLGFSTLCE